MVYGDVFEIEAGIGLGYNRGQVWDCFENRPENEPNKDEVDGAPYRWPNWPKPSNNSNDWINRRSEEAGGKPMLDYRGRWLK